MSITVEKVQMPAIPAIPVSQIVYGEIVYWVTIASALICTIGPALALIFADNNVMNPHATYAAIFAGKKASDVWALSSMGSFPGGHFYAKYLTTGDGLTQLGLALGCGVALPGLIGAAIAYVRDKAYGFVMLSIWVAFLITFSAAGIVNLH